MEALPRFFIEEATRWVRTERDKYRDKGRMPEEREIKLLSSYFTPETLDSVRLAFVDVFENPPFYGRISMGFPQPIDFRVMWGVTFGDTIVAARSKITPDSEYWIEFLFHEFVHVCQYRMLGTETFIERYVGGWAERGFKYRTIPLECDAYMLQYRFLTGGRPFSVEEAVRKALTM